MTKKLSKTESKEEIEEFFKPENLDKKTPKEVKKIKRIAMKYNLPLKEKRKLFCKKCFMPHVDSRIRIKNGIITITCSNCSYKNRWKVK